MFKVGRGQAVGSDDCPFIVQHADLRFSHVNHGLDGECHPRSEDWACAALAEIRDLGFLVEMPTHTMAHEFADYRITVADCLLFDKCTNVAEAGPRLDTLDGTIEDLFS